jgi:hypothetical protein
MAPLRRRNLERRFVLYPERHRTRDKAFLGGGIVQATGDVGEIVPSFGECRISARSRSRSFPVCVRPE